MTGRREMLELACTVALDKEQAYRIRDVMRENQRDLIEKCVQIAKGQRKEGKEIFWDRNRACDEIAAAIRALKDKS